MASPQIENGHIDIANEIADKLCSYRISGQEWQILWVIIRKTWGWLDRKTGKKKKMDSIPLSQFQDLSGIDRRKCHSILNKLVEKNVIKKSVTQKGDRIIISYGFQKNYELWKVSPKKVTVTQKGNKPVTQKGTLKRKRKKEYPDKSKAFVGNFISYIKNTHPNQAPKTKNLEENSLEEIDKLVRLDGFDLEYIRKVIGWAVKDEFWSNQVFSLAGLRTKKASGLTKFQNISAAYEKEHKRPESEERIPVFKVVGDD